MRTSTEYMVCLEMAARKMKPKLADNLQWTIPDLTGKGQTVVPGVTDVGNMRPRVKGGRTKEVKATVPINQPMVEDLDQESLKETTDATSDFSQSLLTTEASTTIGGKRVSLKDLCAEDKKRVANLIKELAKIGEEKENAEKNLEDERKHYEEQILKLVKQQEQILNEREEVQKRLLEYQTCILKLQQDQQLQQLQQHQKNLQQKRQLQPQQNQQSQPGKRDKIMKTSSHLENQGSHVIQPMRNQFQPVNQDVLGVPSHASQPLPAPPNFQQPAYTNSQKDEEDGEGSEENVTDQPSKNFYLNEMEQSSLGNFSTQVQAPLSPPPALDNRRAPPPRPFTAMIDRELASQRQLLAASTEALKSPQTNQYSNSNQALTNQKQSFMHLGANQTENYNEHGNNMDHNIFSQKEQKKEFIREGTEDKKMLGHEGREKNERVANGHHRADTAQTHEYFGTGNAKFLSPEKNELISRFMESQTGVTFSNMDPNQPPLKTDKNKLENGKREGILKRQGDKHSRKKRRRKPPPPAFGPLHPPIMSSTQKSSEFGDYISVDSTVTSDHCQQDRKRPSGMREVSDDEVSDDEEESDMNNNNDKDGNGQVRPGSSKTRSRGSNVEFSSKPSQQEMHSSKQLGVDDFLQRYKQMSASERKKELLKQKSMLLDEQNRLKNILAEQEQQLKLKQKEAMTKMEQMQDLKVEDQKEMKKIQLSMRAMEEDLAKKEQELIRGRELLARKREEQTRVAMETESPEPSGEATETVPQETHPAVIADLRNTNRPLDKPVQQKKGQMAIQSEPRRKNLATAVPSGSEHTAGDVKGAPGTGSVKSPLGQRALIEPEKQMKGKDGDAAVLYPGSDSSDVVKKLDYSLHSDTESETLFNPLPTNEIQQCSTPTNQMSPSIRTKAVGSATSDVGQFRSGPVTDTVDVGTSISYARLPREDPGNSAPKKVSDVRRNKTKTTPKGKSTGRSSVKGQGLHHLQSPGEKTLSVLEIINSMADQETFLNTRRSTLDKRPLVSDLNNSSLGEDLPDRNLGLRTKASHGVSSVSKRSSLGVEYGAQSKNRMEKKFGSGYSQNDRLSSAPSSKFSGADLLVNIAGTDDFGMAQCRPDHLKTGQFKSDSLRSGRNYLNNFKTGQLGLSSRLGPQETWPEDDANLDLFELKRTRNKDADMVLSDNDDVLDDNDDSDTLSCGYDEDDDSNIDDIVKALSLSDDVADERVEDYDERSNESDDEGLLDFVLKNMGNLSVGKSDEDVEDGVVEEEDDDIENGDGDDSRSELEESKILEEVFFVN